MTVVYQWPKEWYVFTQQSFPLRSKSQVSSRPWAGGNSIFGPHAQLWMPTMSGVVKEKYEWQNISAFISRLGGQAGLLRIGHSIRLRPQYSRANAPGSRSTWSDGSSFTDGSGFSSGLLPPTAYVSAPASRGDNNVQIGGLPASIPNVLRPGDLLEFRPNGIADSTPRLHEVVVPGSTDASGKTGVEIRPLLRGGLGVGDMVVLDHPTSVFHLVDDDQGDMQTSVPNMGTFGFSLIEAIENAA